MPTRLVLVRHGESVSNTKSETGGWIGSELSDLGHSQVEKLGIALKDEPFDIILSSDLNRARQTTAAIAEHHSVEVRHIEALRERCYGEFDGHHADKFIAARDASGLPFHAYRPKDGESLESLMIRASNFWRFWVNQSKGKTILLSGHGTFNKVLLTFFLGRTFEQWHELQQDNASVTIIETNEKGVFEAKVMNRVDHLV